MRVNVIKSHKLKIKQRKAKINSGANDIKKSKYI